MSWPPRQSPRARRMAGQVGLLAVDMWLEMRLTCPTYEDRSAGIAEKRRPGRGYQRTTVHLTSQTGQDAPSS